jgi:formate dehydrogenase major subunit
MATQDKEPKRSGISRRTFLKASGAAAAAGAAGLDFALSTSTAQAAPVAKTYHTTCPYCSASCGQRVDVDGSGNVLDIYGDSDSPINQGGLCAKGAAAYQLATNPRRIGAWSGTHPVNPMFARDDSFTDGVAYKRTGNGDWSKVALTTAMNDIATRLVSARGSITPGLTPASNAKSVQFFGCSHMNNEQNYLYRKLIANFGTSLVEHQARI